MSDINTKDDFNDKAKKDISLTDDNTTVTKSYFENLIDEIDNAGFYSDVEDFEENLTLDKNEMKNGVKANLDVVKKIND